MARPRQVSDDQILDAARELLTEDPSTSTVSIAERVGLSQAALFKRFGTKLGLIRRALDLPEAPDWVAVCEAGPDERPVREQLCEIGAELDRFFQRVVPRIAAMKAIGIDLRALFHGQQAPPPVVGHRALMGWFERAMDRGLLRRTDAGGAALALMGSFQSRAFWQHVGGAWFPPASGDDAAYVTEIVELFWRGLAPTEEAP